MLMGPRDLLKIGESEDLGGNSQTGDFFLCWGNPELRLSSYMVGMVIINRFFVEVLYPL